MGILEGSAELIMLIKVNRLTIVKLLCYSRQAARSVHRGHAGDWSAFRQYYLEGREDQVRQLLEEVSRLLPPEGACLPLSRQELVRMLPRIGMVRALVGPWLTCWKSSWWFTVDELVFMAGNLKRLLDILHCPQKPDADALIALRMDLTTVDLLIEARCYGLPEFQARVEHFDHNEGQSFVPIDKILGCQPDSPPTRQSA